MSHGDQGNNNAAGESREARCVDALRLGASQTLAARKFQF